jgi:hypothetical protein
MSKTKWYIGPPFMPEHAEELGRIVALWAILEHLIDGLICQSAGIGLNAGDVFLYHTGIPAKKSILEGIGSLYLKKHDLILYKKIVSTITRIAAYQKRNELVHCNWVRLQGKANSFSGIAALTANFSRRNPNPTYTFWTAKDVNMDDPGTKKIMSEMAKSIKPIATVASLRETGNEISDFIMEIREYAYELNDVLPPPPFEHDPLLYKHFLESNQLKSKSSRLRKKTK